MTALTVQANPFLEHLRCPSGNAGKLSVLRSVREKASDFLRSAELPSARHEDWRYTDLRFLGQLSFRPFIERDTALSFSTAGTISPAEINVALVNGILQKNLLSPLPHGIKVLSGEAALEAAGADAFSELTPNDAELFVRLNEMHFRDLLLIDIEKDADVGNNIHIIHSIDGNSSQNAVFPRVLIRLASGAKARIFESSWVSGCHPVFIDSFVSIVLAEQAALERVQLYRGDGEVYRFLSTRVAQKKDSRFQELMFTDGARIFRNNLSVLLEGEGAESTVNGMHHLNTGLHADSHTYVEHIAPNARSNQLYKAILDGESHSVFNGRICVRREAQQTNSYQLNKNLLLSRTARVDTKPQLEIFADDVKCTHGATIGQLDENQMFYLNTRGIAKDAARRMLIQGFTDDVVNKVRDAGLRGKLIKAVI